MVSKIVSKIIALFVILTFTVTSVVVPDVFAGPMSPGASAMPFQPPMIQGMTLYPDQPLRFDFIVNGEWSMVDKTNPHPPITDPQQEYLKLIRYFLAGLAIPEETMWVNLSPIEPDRIIPETFGQTEMGQTLLAQDYILKKLTASLMNPDTETGKVMWEKIYAQAYARGVTDIPVESLNKVWIVPGKTSVYENTSANSVFVVDHELDVMMEEDYDQTVGATPRGRPVEGRHRGLPLQDEGIKNIIREIIIPVIKEEVNHGESFAPLRQIMNSLILATWYKNALKDSVLTQGFADKAKLGGMASDNTEAKDKIYQQYLGLFRSGVADVIREDYDPVTQTIVPRKYFTGGVKVPDNWAMLQGSSQQLALARNGDSVVVQTDFAMNTPAVNPAMMSAGLIVLLSLVVVFGLLVALDHLFYVRPHKGTKIDVAPMIKKSLEEPAKGKNIGYRQTKGADQDTASSSLAGSLQELLRKPGSDDAQMVKAKQVLTLDDLLAQQLLKKNVEEIAKDSKLLAESGVNEIFKVFLKDLPAVPKKPKGNRAMLEKDVGGIDVRKINVMVEKSGIGVTTAFEDPAMLQRLRNSTGLTPVIFGIETLQTPVFYKLLGLNADGTENHSDPAQPDSKTETAFIRQEQL